MGTWLPLLLVLGCVDLSFPDVRLCDGGACADRSIPVADGPSGERPRLDLNPGGDGPDQDDADDTPTDAVQQDGPDEDSGEDVDATAMDAPLLEPGAACLAASDCLSGFCTDGVCCATACTEACHSCKLANQLGTCSEIDEGKDPDDECADQGQATCGADGTCNGRGACRRYVAGSMCAPAGCSGTTETSARTCDGNGTCLPAATRDCAPYVCATATCGVSCASNAGCKAPAICTAGSCGLRTNGAQCSANTDCVSGICAQGACCATSCSGTCRSCNLAGAAGTCTNVAAGADPLNQCQDAGAAGCGQDGQCNGAGGCRLYQAGISCAAASCNSGAFNGARICNGSGACTGPASVSCGKYQCGPASCRTTCTTAANCVAPSVCGDGACGGLKGDYYDAIDFTVFRFTRTDAQVNFTFPWDNRAGVGSPATSIAADTFSVRWTGTLTAPASGSFTFFTRSDDRVRLTIDGTVIINNWQDHAVEEDSAQLTLVKDRSYAIQLDWVENTEDATITLSWSSAANGISKQLIPTGVLTPAP